MTNEEAYEFIQLYKKLTEETDISEFIQLYEKFTEETDIRIDDFPVYGVVEIWVQGERVCCTEWQAAKIISAESSEEA